MLKQARQPRAIRPIPLATLLLAFALRAHRLAAMSLWSDEDITLDRALLPLREMLAKLPVEHGPFYFAFMRVWTLVAGTSDTALRFPSLVCGVLMVALGGYVGSRLAGRQAGAILAFILAVNPFMVWYGQEARMYTLLGALALGALAAVLRAERRGGRGSEWLGDHGRARLKDPGRTLDGDRGRGLRKAGQARLDDQLPARLAWLAAGTLAASAVLTHYYGALVVFVLVAWAAVDVVRAGRAAARGWLLAGTAAFLVFLPWLPRTFGFLDFTGWRPPLPLGDAPWVNLAAWASGATTATAAAGHPLAVFAVLLYGLLALLGLATWVRPRTTGTVTSRSETYWLVTLRPAALRSLLYLGVPLLVGTLLLIRTDDYHPRYYFAVLPAFYLAVAAGLAMLPAFWRRIGVGLVCVAAAWGLWLVGTDPAFQKQAFRPFVQAVEAAAGHEDTVLFLDGPALGLTKRYADEDSPVKIVNLGSKLNSERTDAEIAEKIAGLTAEYPQLWLAWDGEARGVGGKWLAEHARFVSSQAFQNITLEHYDAGGTP